MLISIIISRHKINIKLFLQKKQMKPDAAKRCAGFHLFERRGECGGEEGAGEKSEKNTLRSPSHNHSIGGKL